MAVTDNNLLLQDIILELQLSNENVSAIETGVTIITDDISSGNDNTIDTLNKIGVVNLSMLNTVNRLYKFFMDNDMIRAEENRELLEAIKGIGINESVTAAPDQKKGSGLLGILSAASVFASGLLIGFFTELVGKLKKFVFYTKIAAVFTRIGEIFVNIGRFIGTLKLGDKIKDVLTGIKNFFGPIGRFIGSLSKGLGKMFGAIGSAFNFILKLIGSTGGGGWLSSIFNFGKSVGKLLGKLFIPITIIMALVESVVGAFKGYEDGGVMGAVKGGLKGLLDSLVGWIIDIPKDLISWILSSFGFEKASEWLDSWDFGTLFDGLWNGLADTWELMLLALSAVSDWWDSWSFDGVFTSIKDFFFGLWDGIIDWLEGVGSGFMEKFGSASDFITDAWRNILKAVLPDRSKGGLAYWTGMMIPDDVYDFANAKSSSAMSPAISASPSTTGGALNASGGGAASVTVINHYNQGGNSTNISSNTVARPYIGGGIGGTPTYGY